MDVPHDGGCFRAEGQAVPFLPSLPLSHLPAPLTCVFLRIVSRTPRFPPALVTLLGFTRRTWTGWVMQVRGSLQSTLSVRTSVSPCRYPGAGCRRCSPVRRAVLSAEDEPSTTESTTWIAATSSCDTWSIASSWGEAGWHLNIQNLWPFRGKVF